MKTDIEIENILYHLIKGSPLDLGTNGDIYKGAEERPDGSEAEDIEIIVIANEPAQIQLATVSINAYATDEIVDGQYRRSRRIAHIAELGKLMFDREIHIGNVFITPESQKTYKERDVNQHYVNFKLNLQIYNR